jgi:hypothetical protein
LCNSQKHIFLQDSHKSEWLLCLSDLRLNGLGSQHVLIHDSLNLHARNYPIDMILKVFDTVLHSIRDTYILRARNLAAPPSQPPLRRSYLVIPFTPSWQCKVTCPTVFSQIPGLLMALSYLLLLLFQLSLLPAPLNLEHSLLPIKNVLYRRHPDLYLWCPRQSSIFLSLNCNNFCGTGLLYISSFCFLFLSLYPQDTIQLPWQPEHFWLRYNCFYFSLTFSHIYRTVSADEPFVCILNFVTH